ncbi:MAG: hypothetical protein KBG47_06725 [Bacteroidia bacterium]|jgi:hypothetical protein|nr:hypothetical protein [Bacteroidia bacterium]
MIAVISITSSCKKNYSCECTSITSGGSSGYTSMFVYSTKSKKKDAEAWCKALADSKVSSNGVVFTATHPNCVIK